MSLDDLPPDDVDHTSFSARPAAWATSNDLPRVMRPGPGVGAAPLAVVLGVCGVCRGFETRRFSITEYDRRTRRGISGG